METAVSETTQKRPRNWDNRVSAAYFRMCGFTQKDAAKAAGISERTIRTYESHESWGDAKDEARNRWFVSLDVRARGALYRDLDESGKGDLGLKVLERMDDRLAPPKIAHELFGKGGAAIEITTVEHNIAKAENGDDDSE